MVKFLCQGKKMVGLAFITPQTSEEAAVAEDDNSNTTKSASRGMRVSLLCEWNVSKSKGEGERFFLRFVKERGQGKIVTPCSVCAPLCCLDSKLHFGFHWSSQVV